MEPCCSRLWALLRSSRFGPAAVLLSAGAVLGACGRSSGSVATGGQARSGPSCAGAAHRAEVVVEPSAGRVVSRCVGFSAATIPATTLLHQSGIEVGTQQYASLGEAICQADHVPAHYSSCLPSGAPYWAVFVSHGNGSWESPPKGISSISLSNGEALGLRYDPPQGNPAPPTVAPTVG